MVYHLFSQLSNVSGQSFVTADVDEVESGTNVFRDWELAGSVSRKRLETLVSRVVSEEGALVGPNPHCFKFINEGEEGSSFQNSYFPGICLLKCCDRLSKHSMKGSKRTVT